MAGTSLIVAVISTPHPACMLLESIQMLSVYPSISWLKQARDDARCSVVVVLASASLARF